MNSLITITKVIDLGTVPSSNQVWVVPGSSSDFNEDDGEYSGRYVMDYLKERGVCIATSLEQSQSDTLIDDIKKKFEREGFRVVVDFTAND